MNSATSFAGLVQAFFTDRLQRQRRASPHTVAGYRDTFRLLLQFAKLRLGKAPSKLSLTDLDAPFVGDFLDHLEKARGNGARSRNTRLAAIHSFFHYLSFQEPAYAEQCRRILAIPSKRYERRLIEYLAPEEIDDLDRPPGPRTAAGGDPDGAAGVRTHRPAPLRHYPGRRAPRPLRGEGPEATVHSAPPGGGRGPDAMAPRVPRRAGDAGIPEQPRRTSEPGCGRATGRPPPAQRRTAMPVTEAKARDTACASPYHGHATASPRDRSRGHRAVAGARISRDDSDVSPCRPAVEGRSALQGAAVERATGAVPT